MFSLSLHGQTIVIYRPLKIYMDLVGETITFVNRLLDQITQVLPSWTNTSDTYGKRKHWFFIYSFYMLQSGWKKTH